MPPLTLRFFGLLFCDATETDVVNAKVNGYRDKILLYLRNSCTLAASLHRIGCSFTLLSNDPKLLREIADAAGITLPAVTLFDPGPSAPRKIKFSSTHQKWACFRYFSTLSGDNYCVLLDLDMIAINPLPAAFVACVANGVVQAYDITAQMQPAYGASVILRDMQSIEPIGREGRWYGGEFIAGTPEFFGALHAQIVPRMERYFHLHSTLFHNGDELLTSIAIELLKAGGRRIDDAGTCGAVGRCWSVHIRHHQPPFAHFYGFCSLLHLPSDKDFLATIGDKSGFLSAYRRYFWWRKFTSGAKYLVKKCVGRG